MQQPKKPKISHLRADFEREAMVHLDTLYGAALRLTRSPSDAEDLVQDSLVKAFRFYERFEAGTNMKAWLLKILRNTFINRYRRTVRERNVFEGAIAQPVGAGVMSRAAMRGLTRPVESAQRRLLAEEIQRALDELPEEHRMIVLLADVEELSYREIADIAGCPIGTVMSRLHRARKALQTRLVDQAVALGIRAESSSEGSPAISMSAYRSRKAAEA